MEQPAFLPVHVAMVGRPRTPVWVRREVCLPTVPGMSTSPILATIVSTSWPPELLTPLRAPEFMATRATADLRPALNWPARAACLPTASATFLFPTPATRLSVRLPQV